MIHGEQDQVQAQDETNVSSVAPAVAVDMTRTTVDKDAATVSVDMLNILKESQEDHDSPAQPVVSCARDKALPELKPHSKLKRLLKY